MNTYYFPDTIKNVATALSNMFNDLVVKKYNSAGAAIQTINIPIRWAPVEKAFDARREGYHDGEDPWYITYPRLSLVGPNLSYAPERAVSVNDIRYWYASEMDLHNLEDFYSDPSPAPYNFNFQLFVNARKMTDWCQIMENILPYFNPELYLRVKEFSFLTIERDLKVLLNGGANLDVPEEIGENDKRRLQSVLDLTVEGVLYMPTSTAKIIKIIDSKYFVDPQGGYTSATGALAEEYLTSGYEELSAGPGAYDFSGTSDDLSLYYFTSANNYDI